MSGSFEGLVFVIKSCFLLLRRYFWYKAVAPDVNVVFFVISHFLFLVVNVHSRPFKGLLNSF